jgi:hypothetical protein
VEQHAAKCLLNCTSADSNIAYCCYGPEFSHSLSPVQGRLCWIG